MQEEIQAEEGPQQAPEQGKMLRAINATDLNRIPLLNTLTPPINYYHHQLHHFWVLVLGFAGKIPTDLFGAALSGAAVVIFLGRHFQGAVGSGVHRFTAFLTCMFCVGPLNPIEVSSRIRPVCD